MNCRKVSCLLSAYMDGELAGVEHLQVREHLRQCSCCEDEYNDVLEVKRLLGSMAVCESNREFANALLDDVKRQSVGATWRWRQELAYWMGQLMPAPGVVAVGASIAALGILATMRLTADEPVGTVVFSAPRAANASASFLPADNSPDALNSFAPEAHTVSLSAPPYVLDASRTRRESRRVLHFDLQASR